MRFLYKIHSGYDGFRPAVLHERLDSHGRLPLGWQRYIESVEEDSEIWVYFHGPHRFKNGVYVKGVPDEVDIDGCVVYLRITERSTAAPLSDPRTTARVQSAVAVRFRQVFLMPEELEAPTCLLASTADSCAARRCDRCKTWNDLPRIDQPTLARPHRLPTDLVGYVPAYWVIPPRSFILYGGRRVLRTIKQTTELFKRFKSGQANLAYPLALGMHRRLEAEGAGPFDAIVPIPLSPEKAARGEMHRTRLLADELSRLAGIPVREVLTLAVPISKRKLRIARGLNAQTFESRYRDALRVDRTAASLARILLVDDVCTEGSTLRSAAQRLREINPDMQVTVTTAGQMVVRNAVRDERPLIDAAA